MTTLTRRHAFALALAAPVALLPVEIAAQPVPPAWRDLITQLARLHPDAEAAAIRAYLIGCDPATFSGIDFARHRDGHDVPVLTFGKRYTADVSYRIVTPTESGTYTPTAAGISVPCWAPARRASIGTSPTPVSSRGARAGSSILRAATRSATTLAASSRWAAGPEPRPTRSTSTRCSSTSSGG
jgi:hypothetical protein